MNYLVVEANSVGETRNARSDAPAAVTPFSLELPLAPPAGTSNGPQS
jgi:hypothetical protein